MFEAFDTKSAVVLGLFGATFFVMRVSGQRFGMELIFLLLALLPYSVILLFVSGYLTKVNKALDSEEQLLGSHDTTFGVELAQFWAKWVLRLWPPFAMLAFAALTLALVEMITGRVLIPIDFPNVTRNYCQFVGNQNGAATFHCKDTALQATPSDEDLASLRRFKVTKVCADEIYAQFRRTADVFRFIYSNRNQPVVTIEVSDKECPTAPPQPPP